MNSQAIKESAKHANEKNKQKKNGDNNCVCEKEME
jgi:hypothetical protein